MARTLVLPIRSMKNPHNAHREGEMNRTDTTTRDAGEENTSHKQKVKKKKVSERFTLQYGSDFSGLAPWIKLCRDLGVETELTSKTQCKRVLENTFINILDLLDAVDRRERDAFERNGDSDARAAALEEPLEVRRFKSERALSAYTLNSGRVYPRGEIKKSRDHPLKLLMRNIISPRRGGRAK